jgi:hypothetical protein
MYQMKISKIKLQRNLQSQKILPCFQKIPFGIDGSKRKKESRKEIILNHSKFKQHIP